MLKGQKVYEVTNCKNEVTYSNTDANLDHSYDNDCDADCNTCGATRETSHSYDNACDAVCNSCGATREAGHSYGEDNVCTVCGGVKSLVVMMYDSYGDGWTDNAIQIFVNGELVDTATITDGTSESWSIPYDGSKVYDFFWVQGDYPEECSFDILIGDVCVFNSENGTTYSTGDRVYATCEHSFDEGVEVDPSCTETGGMVSTCEICGNSYLEGDPVPALGHTLGEDGNCSVCGELYTAFIWVAGIQVTGQNMNDILGDSDEGATASYDAAINTLILNGFNYEGSEYAIYAEMSLNIVVLGDNDITTGCESIYFDMTEGSVEIGGTGSLSIYSEAVAIYVKGDDVDLTLSGSVTIDIDSNNNEGIYLDTNYSDLLIKDQVKLTIGTEDNPVGEEAIYVPAEIGGSVTITDRAVVSVETTDEEGIYVSGEDFQSITISGSAKVYANADEEGLDANTITITGGIVEAYGGSGYEGIFADNLTISGGKVIAGGEEQAIEADHITITGGTVEIAYGGMIAVLWDDSVGDYVPGTITLEGMEIVADVDAELGNTTIDGEGNVVTVLDADGNYMDAFVIQSTCNHID